MKNFKTIITGVIVSAVLLLGQNVFAQTTVKPASVRIPVNVKTVDDDTGQPYTDTENKEKYVFNLISGTPETEENQIPMPGACELKLEANKSGGFGPIEFSEPGKYFYTVTQQKGTTKGTVYDESVFNVFVDIFSKENGGLYGLVYANKDGNDEKVQILFENRVHTEKEEPTEKQSEKETQKPNKESSKPNSGNTSQEYGPKGGVNTGDTPNTGLFVLLSAGLILLKIGVFVTLKRKSN